MKHLSLTLISLLLGAGAVSAQTRAVKYEPSYQMIDPEGKYYNEDLAVATYNVLDYGVDNTGQTDCTKIVQELLDAANGVGGESNNRGEYANITGGIVYFPAGTYLFTDRLTVPRGVTIRGDWKAPDGVNPIEGTIFAIKVPKRGVGNTKKTYSFITMQPATLVSNVAFWYPDQDPSNIKECPPTILLGAPSYWGNEYASVRHCTFVNSYMGVILNYDNGGGCPYVFDVYGTPLYEGIEIDCIADVGRFDGIHYSPVYWETSGLENAPSAGQIDSFLYENATAVVMKRNDWSYTCNMDVEGYRCGFSAVKGKDGSDPNGHNYNFNLRNCKIGVELTTTNGCGMMFTRIKTPGCDTGVALMNGNGPVQFYECDLYGKTAAINMGVTSGCAFQIQDSRMTGRSLADGGSLQAVNCSFSKDVVIGPLARTIFVDNKFSGGAKLNNKSIYTCQNDNLGLSYPTLPEFKDEWMAIKTFIPANKKIFVVTDEAYGAEGLSIKGDLSSAKDNTPIIQKALDDAKAAGGGVVYIPSGHYRCNGTLTIPAGVELKGSANLPAIPMGHGAILEVYAGEGDENGTPFITMEKGASLRGLSINYPTQSIYNIKKFPYSVRGNADVQIVNLSIRAAYRGVDLFTNKCDNHYVDFLSGHAFNNVIRVGGNSENGIVNNTQCNTIAYACGYETKFGQWPNSGNEDVDKVFNGMCYAQNKRELEFFIVGDCKNQVLYNNFLYGCEKGMYFISDGNGGAYHCHSLGNAVDAAVNTFYIDQAATDVAFINSQVVALNQDPDNYANTRLSSYFMRTGKDFKNNAIFFSTDNWGGGDYSMWAEGGNLIVINGNSSASGAKSTMHALEGATINIMNSTVNGVNNLVHTSKDNPRLSVSSSVINPPSSTRTFALWKDNLTPAYNFANTNALESRAGWKATANASAGDGAPSKAIDGQNSTRWGTGRSMAKGDWFMVDFGKKITLNTIILDSSGAAGDGPVQYIAEAYVDGAWKEVATGNGSAVTVIVFEPVTASKVRITLTAGKGNWWSIFEFYVANLEVSGVDSITAESAENIGISGKELLIPSALDGAEVEVYAVSGVKVLSAVAESQTMSLEELPSGIYVVVARSADGKLHTLKIKI